MKKKAYIPRTAHPSFHPYTREQVAELWDLLRMYKVHTLDSQAQSRGLVEENVELKREIEPYKSTIKAMQRELEHSYDNEHILLRDNQLYREILEGIMLSCNGYRRRKKRKRSS